MADLDLVFAELKAVLETHVRGLRIDQSLFFSCMRSTLRTV
jgi:hypothetical protein